MSLTQEQLEQRLNYLTGSDAGIICNLNPWENIIDLWKTKTRLQPIQQKSNPALRMGSLLEPIVAQLFEEETNLKLSIVDSLLVHPTIPYMAGNIDRMVDGHNALVELKTARTDKGWGDYGQNIIPPYYLCQIYHYAIVANVDYMYCGVLFKAQDEFRHYYFERNERFEKLLIEKEAAFWDCVQKMIPPEPRTGNEVISLYGTDVIQDTQICELSVEEKVHALIGVKSAIKDMEEQQLELESIIKATMGKKTILVGPAGNKLATWTVTPGRTSVDTKALQEKYPDAHKECLKKGADFRTFRVK